MPQYLYGQGNYGLCRCPIQKETEHFVWVFEGKEEQGATKISKRTYRTGSTWLGIYWQRETPELKAQYEDQRILIKYKNRCAALQNVTDLAFMKKILAIDLPEKKN
jgi:hypothetical protein